MPPSDPNQSALTDLTYQILLALAGRDLHGYGIIQEMEERGGSAAVPSTGALYLALQRMTGDGLVADRPSPAGADARRRYYRITAAGRSAARHETERLSRLLETARNRNLLPQALPAEEG